MKRNTMVTMSLLIVAALGLAVFGLIGCTSSPATTTSTTTTSVAPPPVTTTAPPVTTTVPPATTTAPPATTTAPATTYTINVYVSATLGTILVDSKGMTLYWTTADSPGTSNVPANLLSTWPVFYASSIAVPSSLNASDFGTITRSDGSKQTTYKNWPLYYYSGDTAAGQTGGQGLGGKWSVVSPAASGPQPVSTPTPTTTAARY